MAHFGSRIAGQQRDFRKVFEPNSYCGKSMRDLSTTSLAGLVHAEGSCTTCAPFPVRAIQEPRAFEPELRHAVLSCV
jgi:hypothetical protein